MTKLERVKKVCKWLIFEGVADNDSELAKVLGYTKSSFSQIMNGKVPLADRFIDALCALNDDINKVWISTEAGHMLISDTGGVLLNIDALHSTKQLESLVEAKDAMIKAQERVISSLEMTVKTQQDTIKSLQDHIILLKDNSTKSPENNPTHTTRRV